MKCFFLLFIFNITTIFCQEKSQFQIENWRTLLYDSITDIDGNKYSQQKMGNQIWLVENLKVTRFNNGDTIIKLQDSLLWISTNSPAFCNVEGRTFYSQRGSEGILHKDTLLEEQFYNSYVITDSRNVCPQGWHVPSTSEWKELEERIQSCNFDFLSQFYDSTSVWFGKVGPWDLDLTFDGLSFSNQPFGYRLGSTGEFFNYRDFGHWWSKDIEINVKAWSSILYDRGMGVDDLHIENEFGSQNKQRGMSIKCIKD